MGSVYECEDCNELILRQQPPLPCSDLLSPECSPSQIVVVDATDTDSLARSCSAMKEHLEDPRVTPLPCMILLNKKDKKLIDTQVSLLSLPRLCQSPPYTKSHLRLVQRHQVMSL